jgi:hypothetical protein
MNHSSYSTDPLLAEMNISPIWYDPNLDLIVMNDQFVNFTYLSIINGSNFIGVTITHDFNYSTWSGGDISALIPHPDIKGGNWSDIVWNPATSLNLPTVTNVTGWVNATIGSGTVAIYVEQLNATNQTEMVFWKNINVTGVFADIFNSNSLRMLGLNKIELRDPDSGAVLATFTANVKANVTMSLTGANVKLGQVATFKLNVQGPSAANTAAIDGLGLGNVTVTIKLPNMEFNVTTDPNGDYEFNWTVTQMDFSVIATTLFNSSSFFTYLGNTSGSSRNYSEFYNDDSITVNYTAGKGISNVTDVWFSSPHGYLIGENATIFWLVDGVVNLTGKEFVLFFFSNGIDQRGAVRVPALQMIDPVRNVLAYYFNTTFKHVHDALTIVVVYPEDTEYSRSEARNTTFVDKEGERRTTINVTIPPALKVGVNGNIQVQVLAFNGAVVQNGKVTIMWDNNPEWSWDTDIINGVANLHKEEGVYTTAGLRTYTITYHGDTLGNKSSSYTNTTNISRGDVEITVAQSPSPAFVGENVAIAAHVNNIAIGGTPQYITFNFKRGNELLHTSGPVAIEKATDSTGIAQFSYAYKQAHTALTIEAVFTGDINYAPKNGTLPNVVVNTVPSV